MSRWAPIDGPELLLRPEALDAGWSDGELQRAVRADRLVRVRRGAYADHQELTQLDRIGRHKLDVAATWAGMANPGVVSHSSAAALLGIPLFGCRYDRVHLTRTWPAHSRREPTLAVHVARIDDADIVRRGRLPVTSPARTVVDVARQLGFERGLVSADHVLRTKMCDYADLVSVAESIRGTPGSRVAGRVVRHADARSESVGESRSRSLMIEFGLPMPELQMEIRDDRGVLVARTDFGFEWAKVIVEFDGRVKYGRYLRPGETPGDAVFREKRREDAIRAEGYAALRWTWDDLYRPRPLADRLHGALQAGAPRRYRSA